MGEVQSPGQELQLVMPEWQPRAEHSEKGQMDKKKTFIELLGSS